MGLPGLVPAGVCPAGFDAPAGLLEVGVPGLGLAGAAAPVLGLAEPGLSGGCGAPDDPGLPGADGD